MTSTTINPLAIPKGDRKLCEVCQKPPRLQCTGCRVTFYCNQEHQAADWVGIHEEVCQRLAVVRGPSPAQALQADRDAYRALTRLRLEELLGVCREVARVKLVEDRHQEALPALQLALRCGLEVYGPAALQLVPLHLLLGQAHLGLGRLSRARDHLSQAEWSVLQTPGCERVVLHQLHRALGRLHSASGDLDTALFHLATDVYLATEEFGLDSTVPCGGYFLMAEVFGRQEKKLVARSLYSEIASTWHNHLTRMCEPCIKSGSAATQSPFDQTQLVETDRMLRSMLAFEEKEKEEKMEEEKGWEVPVSERGHQGVLLGHQGVLLGHQGVLLGHQGVLLGHQGVLLGHSLAMLWFLAGDTQQVLEFGRGALQAARLVPDRGQAGPIQDLLRLVGSDPQPTQTTQEGPGPPADPDPQQTPGTSQGSQRAGHP